MSEWAAIEHAISTATGRAFASDDRRAVLGGDINDAHVLADSERRFFVKTNRPDRRAMFEAEAAGLAELRQATLLRVPEPVTVDATEDLGRLA